MKLALAHTHHTTKLIFHTTGKAFKPVCLHFRQTYQSISIEHAVCNMKLFVLQAEQNRLSRNGSVT